MTPQETLAKAPAGFPDLAGAARRPGVSLAVTLFLVGLAVPLILHAGPFRLSPYRLVLLVTTVPCVVYCLSGRAGGIRFADVAVLAIWGWSALATIIVHDAATAAEPSGILFLESAGAYFLARSFVRTADAFLSVARTICGVVLVMLPFALWETLTAENLALKVFRLAGTVHPDVYKAPRLGLDRVQGPFEHPILFGVFCGTAVALGYYVLGHGHGFGGRLRRALPAAFAALASLSSGPLIALMAQGGLIAWDRVAGRLAGRWWWLSGGLGLGYALIAALSNRAPVVVLASYLAFNLQTAYSRVSIWEWGTRSIFEHPLFGIGFNDWEREPWMTDSVDMFWILPAIRHGIPVWVLGFVFFAAVIAGAVRARGLDERESDYRTGWAIVMIGLFMAGWTVHFWNATFALFMFLAGCGAWFREAGAARDRRRPFTRPG